MKKFYRVIEFNQTPWPKPYIDINRDLKKKARTDFEKEFFKLMNNAFLGKAMENVRKYRMLNLSQRKEEGTI